jgi:hypothetical protein
MRQRGSNRGAQSQSRHGEADADLMGDWEPDDGSAEVAPSGATDAGPATATGRLGERAQRWDEPKHEVIEHRVADPNAVTRRRLRGVWAEADPSGPAEAHMNRREAAQMACGRAAAWPAGRFGAQKDM